MEHVRLSYLTADPPRLEEAVRYIDDDARKRVEDEPGSRGLTLVTNRDVGVAVIQSFWVSGDAMRATERTVVPIRKEVARRSAGTVAVEFHEVASSLRVTRPRVGARLRLTRMEIDPRRVDDALAAYEDTAHPWLTDSDGLCLALLFVHRRSGRAIHETIWRDESALVASRRTEASIRLDTVTATDASVRALEEFTVVFNTARID